MIARAALLMLAVSLLAVAPVSIVYYFSLQFLHRGLDSWFDVRIEQALEDSLELSRSALDVRLERNRTPLRLEHKPSKRDLAASDSRLLMHEDEHRFNTDGEFYYPDRHLKVDNTHLDPEEVARMIVDHFGLPTENTTS